jgi:hypothetical protein
MKIQFENEEFNTFELGSVDRTLAMLSKYRLDTRYMLQSSDDLPIQHRVCAKFTLIGDQSFEVLGVCVTKSGDLFPYFGINGSNYLGVLLSTSLVIDITS